MYEIKKTDEQKYLQKKVKEIRIMESVSGSKERIYGGTNLCFFAQRETVKK